MSQYGSKRATCVNKLTGKPKGCWPTRDGAERYIERREASGLVARDRLVPYRCRHHNNWFHVGGVTSRSRRGGSIRV